MASKPIAESITADHDADVVVFLIGMRINRWRSVRYWVPVLLAFLPMVRELLTEPSSGCRSIRTFWSGRTILTVQYWDSVKQLIDYAHDPRARHRPAWRAFNRNAAKTTAVGIFHETYSVQSGHYETIYRAMPPTGLAAATDSVAPVARRGVTARDRLAGMDQLAGQNPLAGRHQPAAQDRLAARDRLASGPLRCPYSATGSDQPSGPGQPANPDQVVDPDWLAGLGRLTDPERPAGDRPIATVNG